MKIGITGSIGSGKSTVCDYLRDKGFHVFDCDKYCTYLLSKDNKGYLRLKEEYPSLFDEDILNKKRMSDLLFTSKKDKEKINSLIHPLVLEKILSEINDYKPYFAEVPLLFESGFDKYFDYNLLIVSDYKIALDRLRLRGINNAEAKRRLNNQMAIEEKKKRSNGIIYNNGDLANLYSQVDKWLKENVR